MICEGVCDTAAALTLGFAAVGVPGAGACNAEVLQWVRACPVACPCIVADNDEAGIVVDLLDGAEHSGVKDEVRRWNPKCSFPTMVLGNEGCIVGYDEGKIREALGP